MKILHNQLSEPRTHNCSDRRRRWVMASQDVFQVMEAHIGFRDDASKNLFSSFSCRLLQSKKVDFFE
jgi:hypothetical protein